MAENKDITYRKVKRPSAEGMAEYHSVDVINENGVPIKSLNTPDSAAASNFINEAKKDYPGATINGDPAALASPFPEDDSVGGAPGAVNKPTDDDNTPVEHREPGRPADDPYAAHDPTTGGQDQRYPTERSKISKKTRDLSGVKKTRLQDWHQLTEIERGELRSSGLFGAKRVQAMIDRQGCASEKVFRGLDNNAFIVLGNDRVHHLHTGYGGKGHTQSDAIDIVVGLAGYSPKEFMIEAVDNTATDENARSAGTTRKTIQAPTKPNPNFFVDAARIYISQKTDVDKNFGIAEFYKKSNEETCEGGNCAKSAIAVKADNVRLIARETMRLVTGTDRYNSQGGKIDGEKAGIELIANNDHTTLQPLVLGDNLAEGMRRVLHHVEAISHTFHAFVKFQLKFNQALQKHTHNSPFFGIFTTESFEAMWKGFQLDLEIACRTEVDMLKHGSNLAGVKSKYFYESGTKWIGSSNNKTN
jgi:hypothetical protein